MCNLKVSAVIVGVGAISLLLFLTSYTLGELIIQIHWNDWYRFAALKIISNNISCYLFSFHNSGLSG